MLLANNNTTFHGGFPTILHLAHSTLNGGKGAENVFFQGGSTNLQLIVGKPFMSNIGGLARSYISLVKTNDIVTEILSHPRSLTIITSPL